MEYHIFYSWQSDLDNKHSQRNSILKAINSAKKRLVSKQGVTLYIDQATRDTSGAINIAATIEQKIRQSDVFIADISIINRGSKFRNTPNPNVMYELGLATEAVGWSNIILVLNKAYGDFDDLPFDIKTRRVIQFNLKGIQKDNIAELTDDLAIAIHTCLDNAPKLRLKEITNALKNSEWEAYNFFNGQIDKTELKGKVSIRQVHNHIFSFDFDSYENGEEFKLGDWAGRFFVNENTLTTAQLVFRSKMDFGFKTIIFPLDREYQELYLIGTLPDYGKQVLIKKNTTLATWVSALKRKQL
jgi:hypothetical protein